MDPDEPDLDELTQMLGQCLGRIDELAYRLQEGSEQDEGEGDGEADGADDVLETEAGQLQMILGSLLQAVEPQREDQADLNRTVQRAIDTTIREIGFPIVVRQNLADDVPPIACRPGQVTCAVQRALLLATSHAGTGGEVRIGTRCEAGTAVLEIEAFGNNTSSHLRERAVTLRAFVHECQGNCRVDVDGQGVLLLAIDLPASTALDER